MSPIIVLVILALVAVVLYSQYKKKNTQRDIVVPPVPDNLKRKDLLYGYYGCLDEQVAETLDHINLFMATQWGGPDKMVQNILTAKLPTMLDVSPQVFCTLPGDELRSLSPNAETGLRAILSMLQSKGALKYVRFIYPQDEPNGAMKNQADFLAGLAIIKRVAAEFLELAGVKYVVIYKGGKPFVALDQYDIVGFDAYGQKSSVLTGSEYLGLKAGLRPGQKTILVPGGAGNWGQDPVPFVNFAESNPEVAILMPFIWFDHPANDSDGLITGIRSGPLKDAYIAAGKSII